MNTHVKDITRPYAITPIWARRLSDSARAAMTTTFMDLECPYSDSEQFIASLLPGLIHFGQDLLQDLRAFATNADSPGVMILENLPIDPDLPSTPQENDFERAGRNYVGEAVTLGLGSLLGEPIGYRTEKDGDILHNLIPAKGAEQTQSNRGSKTLLTFHNDSVYDESGWFHCYNADFLVLYGHRPDAGFEAETLYVDGRVLTSMLSPEQLETLSGDNFQMAAPSNFTLLMNGGEKVWSKPGPVIAGGPSYPETSIAANGVRGLTQEADAAFAALQEICARPECRVSVKIDSGMALMVNNRKGVHARSSFTPTFGPDERWLLRANVRRDLWSMRHRLTARWHSFN